MFIPDDVTSNRLSTEESSHLWRIFRALPESRRAIIAAPGTAAGIRQLHETLHLGEFSVRMVSLVVRKILFEEWDEAMAREQLSIVLSEEGGDVSSVETILDFIKKKIFIIQSIPEEGGNVRFSLMQALGKFEKLGGQQITNSKIVVKGQNDPVRPTIFNWLRAYRDELGVGAHDAVARGQFLFHSLNGKGLSSEEREQVGMILKSLDENMPLSVDVERQEVVFREQGTRNREQGTMNREQGTTGREQIQNTKYEIPNTTSLSSDGGKQGNISRAVFDLPPVREQGTENREQGTMNREQGAGNNEQGTESREPIQNTKYEIQNTNQGRPSAFEQARAIQEANRASRLSISNFASETVELGEMEIPREEVHEAPTLRPRIEPIPSHIASPAPRAISFEPAKIDTFSFGSGRQNTFQERLPASGGDAPAYGRQAAPKAERPMFTNGDNVGSVSFSTNHVMPVEKEVVNKEQGTMNSEQTLGNNSSSGLRRLADETVQRPLPNTEQPARIATRTVAGGRTPPAGGSNSAATAQPVPIQKPTAPINRYRITPMGHNDETTHEKTSSPYVVDLRG